MASQHQQSVEALADALTELLGFPFHSQWVGPDSALKGNIPIGVVTMAGGEYEYEGEDIYEEPVIGATVERTRLGNLVLNLQVDMWADSIDDRWSQLEKLEEAWNAGIGGDLFVDVGEIQGRFTRSTFILTDTPSTAADREWRSTFDVTGTVDLIREENVPLMDIRIDLRLEDDRRGTPYPIPEGNDFGITLTADSWNVDELEPNV